MKPILFPFLSIVLALTLVGGAEAAKRDEKKNSKAAQYSQIKRKKVDLTPDFNPSKHASNEEAMKNTKFKLAPKDPLVKVGITCTDTSGRILNQGDAGYEGCLTDSNSNSPERRTNSGPTATLPVVGQ